MADSSGGMGWNAGLNAPAAAAVSAYAPQPQSDFLGDLGWFATWTGVGLGAVSAYYGIEAQKGNLKAQASSLDFQGTMATQAREQAERDAQYTLLAGQDEKASLTLKQGQERASLIAGQAGSGATAGGSNAEIRASQRLIARIDAMTLDSNTLRAANAARMRATNYGNEALLDRVSAENARGSAGSLDPGLAVTTSLLNSAGSISKEWSYRSRRGWDRYQ